MAGCMNESSAAPDDHKVKCSGRNLQLLMLWLALRHAKLKAKVLLSPRLRKSWLR